MNTSPNTWKKIPVILFITLLLFTGCNTLWQSAKDTLNDEQKVAQIARTVETTTTLAVRYTINWKPETEETFRLVNEGLSVALDTGVVAPTLLKNLLRDYVASEAGEEYADVSLLALDTVLVFYSRFYELNWEDRVKSLPAFYTVLNALQRGVAAGYGEETTAGTEAVVKPIEVYTDEDLSL